MNIALALPLAVGGYIAFWVFKNREPISEFADVVKTGFEMRGKAREIDDDIKKKDFLEAARDGVDIARIGAAMVKEVQEFENSLHRR
jgi:hypothetical protein